jgi:RNase H-fold protein (predicted Holliday junction resolvase)
VRQNRKEVVDAMAATLILRTYLEIHRSQTPRGDEG